jgi:hypothetical protein
VVCLGVLGVAIGRSGLPLLLPFLCTDNKVAMKFASIQVLTDDLG